MRRPGSRGTFENPQIVAASRCRNSAASGCSKITHFAKGGFCPRGGDYCRRRTLSDGVSSRSARRQRRQREGIEHRSQVNQLLKDSPADWRRPRAEGGEHPTMLNAIPPSVRAFERQPLESLCAGGCSSTHSLQQTQPCHARLNISLRDLVSATPTVQRTVHVSDDSNSDILHPLIFRETGLRQEVDIGSSTEITVRAGLTQISRHGGNRCVFHQQSAGPIGAFRSRLWASAGTISGTILGTEALVGSRWMVSGPRSGTFLGTLQPRPTCA